MKYSEPTLSTREPRLEPDWSANGQWLPESHVRPCRYAGFSLQEEQIRHRVIEKAEENSAMRNTVVAHISFRWRPLAETRLFLDPKAQF